VQENAKKIMWAIEKAREEREKMRKQKGYFSLALACGRDCAHASATENNLFSSVTAEECISERKKEKSLLALFF